MTGDNPLDPLDRIPGRPVDPAFADRLESELRVLHASRPPVAPPPRRWVTAFVPALVVVAVVSAVLLFRTDTPSAALELVEAENVTVTLADGSVLEDPTGLELSEGMVVTVGAGGFAVIGDIELAPGSEVVVRGDRLVTADPVTTTTAPAGSRPGDPPDDPDGGFAAADDGPAPSDATSPTTTGREADDGVEQPAPPVDPEPSPPAEPGDTTTVPVRSDPPDTTAPARPSVAPPSDEPPGPTDGAGSGVEDPDVVDPEPDRVVDIALRVGRTESGISVQWQATGEGLDAVELIVLRGEGVEPDWPAGPGVLVLARTGASGGSVVDDLVDPSGVRAYRVVALVDGQIVARSVTQTLSVDGG